MEVYYYELTLQFILYIIALPSLIILDIARLDLPEPMLYWPLPKRKRSTTFCMVVLVSHSVC